MKYVWIFIGAIALIDVIACVVFISGPDDGWLRGLFVSEDSLVFQNWEQVPPDGVQMDATAYFSSDASRFGDNGVLIWAGFEFLVDGSPRAGVVLVDLDLSRAPLDGDTPMPHSAIRAEYLEKWEEQVFFAGEVAFGDQVVSVPYGRSFYTTTFDLVGTSNVVVITGPSRTGDIDSVLTLGVHGPRHLHIVVVEPGSDPY